MFRRLWPIVLITLLGIVALVVWLSQDTASAPAANSNKNVPVSYISGSNNQLIILHLNQTVHSSKFNFDLTLISPLTVATTYGQVVFRAVDDLQTVANYQLRLISSTATSAEVVIVKMTE